MKFKNLLTLTGLTLTGLAVSNAIIDNRAKEKNMFNDDAGYYFTWKKGNIYYKVKGKGSPVLLVHDLNVISSGYEYSRIEKLLSKTHTVYTIDLLGCGQSDKPAITYTNFLYVQLLNHFCDEVIKEKCHVIASHDSAPTVIMAQKMEDNFKKIILINPTDFDTLNMETTKLDMFFKQLLYLPIIGPAIYNYGASEEKIKDVLQGYFSRKYNFQKTIDAYYEAAHLNNSNGRFLYACKKCNYLGCNVSLALEEIKNIHIIMGQDYDKENKIVDSYKEVNPKIKSYVVEKTNQVPHLENAKATFEVITKIIK